MRYGIIKSRNEESEDTTMKKIFAAKVTTVTEDGYIRGEETICYTLTAEKAAEVAKAWTAEHEKNCWWMLYKPNKEKHIEVTIEELGNIIE